MKSTNGERLVHQARYAGVSLRIKEGGVIGLTTAHPIPSELLDDLKRNRDAVLSALRDEAEFEKALTKWLPSLGSAVKDTATGRVGRVWGATRHGLIVDYGPGAPLLTLDPRQVTLLP